VEHGVEVVVVMAAGTGGGSGVRRDVLLAVACPSVCTSETSFLSLGHSHRIKLSVHVTNNSRVILLVERQMVNSFIVKVRNIALDARVGLKLDILKHLDAKVTSESTCRIRTLV
jgi:uncharacterized membrane protein YeiH